MKEDQASITAFTVLQGFLYVARKTEFASLVTREEEAFAELILGQSDAGRRRLKQIDRPFITWLVKLRERLLLPGITVHYVLRKKYIEEVTLEAIAEGAEQVVNLGAGFDGLAYRLSDQYPDVSFIEIDHPQTHRLKSRALEGRLSGRDNFHFLSVDFSQQELHSALQESNNYAPSKKTLFICEGVLMYLDRSDISKIFNALGQLSGSGSSIVFTSLEPKSSPKNNMRSLLFGYLKMIGEPIKWMLPSEKAGSFLAEHNSTLVAYADTSELIKKYIVQPTCYTFHSGEYLMTAKFDEVTGKDIA